MNTHFIRTMISTFFLKCRDKAWFFAKSINNNSEDRSFRSDYIIRFGLLFFPVALGVNILLLNIWVFFFPTNYIDPHDYAITIPGMLIDFIGWRWVILKVEKKMSSIPVQPENDAGENKNILFILASIFIMLGLVLVIGKLICGLNNRLENPLCLYTCGC